MIMVKTMIVFITILARGLFHRYPFRTRTTHHRHYPKHKRNYTNSLISSSTTTFSFFYLAVVLCDPASHVVNALPLPLVTTANEMILRSTSFARLGSSSNAVDPTLASGRQQEQQQVEDGYRLITSNFPKHPLSFPYGENRYELPEKTDEAHEDAGLNKSATKVMKLVIHPLPRRRKKGLSYLSKYFNGSTPVFFGPSSGGGGGSSGEQRIPSIRQKLSFYPPITSTSSQQSIFMAPWSRAVGRHSTMRLRWGK